MMVLEPSQIDRDFDEYVFVISQKEYEEIGRKLKESDELTYRLRGKGWASGPRSYQKVHDFL